MANRLANRLTRRERLALWLYCAVVWLIQPLVRRKLLRRARQEPEYGRRIEERFGRYSGAPSAGWWWVHAVSLGETRAAAPLIAQLRSLQPGMQLLLTHSTASGWAAGGAVLAPGDRQVWFPWDTPAAVDSFLAHFKPRVGLLLETEVWPNLVQACARHGMPLFLVNARLNRDSYAAADRLRWLAGPAYRALAGAFAQSRADANHLAALGAPVGGVMGNVKFDAQPVPDQLLAGRAWRMATGRPVLLLVSSREGEEAALIAALSARRSTPDQPDQPSSAQRCYQIMVVPRHPQRVSAVAGLFRAAGFSVSRRSGWIDKPHPADVWLGDSLGELSLYYALSDVALLGGSFARFGGQNLIEAAACGCPLVMGPHTFNFADAAQWAQQAGAAARAPDMYSGVDVALRWIDQPDQLEIARRCCLEFALAHQGASSNTADALLGRLAATLPRPAQDSRPADGRQPTDSVPPVNTPVAHRAGAT